MKRPISPTTHGIIDYATVAAVAVVPELLDFPKNGKWLCRSLAANYLAVSLLTDYPLAAKRVIPFKVHGMTEGALGAVLPALPWALGFADHKPARNFIIGLTAVTAIVAALTDWSTREERRDRQFDQSFDRLRRTTRPIQRLKQKRGRRASGVMKTIGI